MEEHMHTGYVVEGIVVKAAMKDTCTVAVSRYVKHPKYKKYLRKTKKYLVHNPGNSVQVGDTVTIRATRPISKRKHFVIASRIARVDTPAAANGELPTTN